MTGHLNTAVHISGDMALDMVRTTDVVAVEKVILFKI